MKKLLHLAAVPFLAVVITGGMASAATMTTVEETGPDSKQTVKVNNDNTVDLDNDNTTNATVHNNQDSDSGDAKVRHNTTGKDAESGDANTDFTVDANVRHTNASSSTYALNSSDCDCEGATTNISNIGPDSTVLVEVDNINDIDVTNDNDFVLDVHNTQDSTTGDATVADNTTGGGATTGDADATASVTIDHFTSN